MRDVGKNWQMNLIYTRIWCKSWSNENKCWRGEIKIEWRIASSCLHDQQDLCWGNTSRDTSEESQESQVKGNSMTKEQKYHHILCALAK